MNSEGRVPKNPSSDRNPLTRTFDGLTLLASEGETPAPNPGAIMYEYESVEEILQDVEDVEES